LKLLDLARDLVERRQTLLELAQLLLQRRHRRIQLL